MIRDRKEESGITTRYDPIKRNMTILDKNGNVFEDEFDQTLINSPTRIVLEIDAYCTSACKYCSEGPDQKRIRLPKQKVFQLIDEAEKMKIHEVTIRGGEATLHPDFDEIWNYAVSKDFTTANLITNGMVLTVDKVRQMLENPRAKMIVSVDGFKEINSIFRDPTQYDKAMPWVLELLKDKPAQIVMLSCLYKQNYSNIPKFSKFLAERGLIHYHITPLKRLGRSEMDNSNFVSLNEMENLQNDLENISLQYPQFDPTISCTSLNKYENNKTNMIPVPLFNEMYYGTGLKVMPTGQIMINRGIMFTKNFKQKVLEEVCLDPLGSVFDEKSFQDLWAEKRDERIQQGLIADKHYGYYLGWLKSL